MVDRSYSNGQSSTMAGTVQHLLFAFSQLRSSDLRRIFLAVTVMLCLGLNSHVARGVSREAGRHLELDGRRGLRRV